MSAFDDTIDSLSAAQEERTSRTIVPANFCMQSRTRNYPRQGLSLYAINRVSDLEILVLSVCPSATKRSWNRNNASLSQPVSNIPWFDHAILCRFYGMRLSHWSRWAWRSDCCITTVQARDGLEVVPEVSFVVQDSAEMHSQGDSDGENTKLRPTRGNKGPQI
jgi:hypothetical protein